MNIALVDRHHGCRLREHQMGGHTYVILENRRLRVSVLVTKGADITEIRYKPMDLDFLWHGPHRLFPPGQLIPTTGRANGAFLDYFVGGWQEVLPNGGDACLYRGAEIGQHGEVALMPWQFSVEADSPELVSVTFSIRTHRTPFYLTRTMSLSGEEPALRLQEVLVNEGEEELAYMWGHHPGFGPPFIEEGCVLDLPGGTIFTRADTPRPGARYAPGQVRPWPEVLGLDGTSKTVNLMPGKSERGDDDFTVGDLPAAWAVIRNPRLGVGLGLSWDINVFPYLWCWQVSGGSQGYPYYGRLVHLAVEPFSSPIGNLVENDARGQAPHLKAGESIESQMLVAAFEGSQRMLDFTGGKPRFENG